MAETKGSPGHRQRLKDRYLKASLDGFHDYEVLEILLTYAIPRRDVKPLAKTLIQRFKSLKGVFDAGIDELSSIKGVGENTAMFILLVKAAAFAYPREEGEKRGVIRSPAQAIGLIRTLDGDGRERFLAICLNTKNEVIEVETLHTGAMEMTSVSARGMIEKAIKYNARSVIFVHALPEDREKGSTKTNNEKYLSQELFSAASAVDIIVHDYLISGKNGFVSAREKGWLK
jgi:DNA repair protein RadC